MIALSAFNFTNLSFCASSIALSMTFALPFPFAFSLSGSTSLTFCVALVVQRDGALACDNDGSGAGTLSLAGGHPMNSAVLYQLQLGVDPGALYRPPSSTHPHEAPADPWTTCW
jgi:hypothetical protein